MAMELRLPLDKLDRLKITIAHWRRKRSCTKWELLSLIGQLQYACKVVWHGRAFLCRMITLSTTAKKLHHRIRLNASFRLDLEWWAFFLPKWNGISIMAVPCSENPGAVII